MALDFVFMDGFDNRSAAQIGRRYTSGGTGGTLVTGASTRYNYGQAINAPLAFRHDTLATYQYWIVGFAFKTANATTLWGIKDSSTEHVYVELDTDGSVKLFRGGGTLLVDTSTGVWATNTWHHCGIALKIGDGTSGEMHLWVDEIERASLTGIDTQVGSNAFATGNTFSRSNGGIFDDIYIMAGTPTADVKSEFPGDLWVSTYMPTADTTQKDWTPQGGGDNYVEVDEIPADDDTTYVTGTTAEDTDLFTFPSLEAEVGAIKAVQLGFTGAQAPGAASGQTCRNVYRHGSGGTIYECDVLHALQADTTKREFVEIEPTDKNTGLAWTSSGWSDLQAGYRKKS